MTEPAPEYLPQDAPPGREPVPAGLDVVVPDPEEPLAAAPDEGRHEEKPPGGRKNSRKNQPGRPA